MKKTIIAGAASLALAAMPMAGVFAVGTTEGAASHIDTFKFTIAETCTFARAASAHGTASTGTWTSGTGTDTESDENGIAVGTDQFVLTTAVAGNTYSMGDSSFVVKCNYAKGYDINVEATALTSGDNTIPVGQAAVSENASTWTITKRNESGKFYGYGTSKKVQSNAGANDITTGESFTMEYNLGLAKGQAAGTYAGTATYTLSSPAVTE